MTHGSLFSGIGGFDLASQWMGWENKFHCEWNEFGQRVLRYYWPNATSYDDITKTDFTIWGGESTSSQVDSLANHIQQQEKDLEKKMTDTSGQKCLEQFERFNRAGSWAKMFSELLIGMEGWSSKRCRLTWRLKGTKYNRMYFQLQVSTLPTEGTGFGLLLTAIASDWKRRGPNSQQQGLPEMAYSGMLPTPRANKVNGLNLNSEKLANRNKGNLEETVAKWVVTGMISTPTANDAKNATMPDSQKNRDGLTKHFHHLKTGKTSQLNPQFVMEMMGFPSDWTELPFLNGEMNQTRQEETQ